MGEFEEYFNNEYTTTLERLEYYGEKAMTKPNVERWAARQRVLKIVDRRFHHKVFIYGKYAPEKEKNWDNRGAKYGWAMLTDIDNMKRERGLSFDEAFIKITRNAALDERKIIAKNIALIKAYLNYQTQLVRENGMRPNDTKPRQLKQNNPLQKTEDKKGFMLEDAFKNFTEYDHVINGLAKEGYCTRGLMDLYTWTNREKGYKTVVCALLYFLNSKSFFTRWYTDKELQEIAKNTFGIEITTRTFQAKERINTQTGQFNFLLKEQMV